MTAAESSAGAPTLVSVHGLRIGVVVAGIGATLPMFQLGAELAAARGLGETLAIAFFSCALVGALGSACSVVGARTRLSTYEILAFSFGRRGVRAVNVILAGMLIGWFATTGALLGAAVQGALASGFAWRYPLPGLITLALALMTVTGIFGFAIMERLASVTVPLLAGLMGFVVALALWRHGIGIGLARAGALNLSRVDALSSVVGAIILTAVLAPDLSRFAHNGAHAVLSVWGLALGFPVVLALAAIPSAVFGVDDIMAVMRALRIPGLAILVIVMATWTSNTSNLYSATLTLATLFRRTSTVRLGLIAAGIAWVLALSGIADHFIPLLIGLGVVSAPLAGVYVVDYYWVHARRYEQGELDRLAPIRLSAFAAWGLGSAVGLAGTYRGVSASGLPAVDSIVVAAVAYGLLHWRGRSLNEAPGT